MKQAVLARKSAVGPVATTQAAKAESGGLRIGEPDDAFEQEADRVADEVMAGDSSRMGWSLAGVPIDAGLQRKCACGGSGGAEGECEECKKKETTLQRQATGSGGPATAPPIVDEVLRSPGQPLDAATRAFFEPRFGHDFSRVRIHTGARAAESAQAVNALAYTVGRHIVFGSLRYDHATGAAKNMVAHELAHVVQQGHHDQMPAGLCMSSIDDSHERQATDIAQGMSGPCSAADKLAASENPFGGLTRTPQASLQRACLPAADCAVPASTLTTFVQKTTTEPAQVSKQKKREAACTKKPPDPACTADGHGAPANALMDILKANYPSRLGFITGIFVDKDMPKEWGAFTTDCSSFMPPLPGSKCTFVPDALKTEGESFQKGAKTVGGQPRKEWLTATIGTLTHETEHARFDVAAPIPEPSPTACKFADLENNLSEMAADLSEMHVVYRDALTRPQKDRFKHFHDMFNFWVKGGKEDISGTVKDLRCKCECGDADHYIIKTVESVSTSQKWDTNEQSMIHSELQQAKWGLKWPVNPPATINVADLPTVAPAPLKFE
jgi:hypothetical protein